MIANCPGTRFTPATRFSASATSLAAKRERSSAESRFIIWSDSSRSSRLFIISPTWAMLTS